MTTRKGGVPRITRRAALASMQQWIEIHGRIPVYSDWEIAGHGHPCAKTIDRHWGWDAFRATAVGVSKGRLRELTLHGRPAYPLPGWPRSELLQALIDHYLREGTWPTGHEWEAATLEHPSWRTYRRRFGTWQQAVDAAAREVARRGRKLEARTGRRPRATPPTRALR